MHHDRVVLVVLVIGLMLHDCERLRNVGTCVCRRRRKNRAEEVNAECALVASTAFWIALQHESTDVCTAIRVRLRVNEKPGEASEKGKNISCSVKFLCIPICYGLFESDVELGLTERKHVRKMQ